MSISPNIKEYLDKEKVSYEILQHPIAYTAMETASEQHVPGKQVVKAVIVKADQEYVMCALSSLHLIDFDKLKSVLNARELQLATEVEVAKLFPEYEIGAEPPFGHLHGLKVYVDASLSDNEDVVFNAGTHTDMVKIKWSDFVRLVKPEIKPFGRRV